MVVLGTNLRYLDDLVAYLMSCIRPCLTSAWASSFFPILFNTRPFIQRVSPWLGYFFRMESACFTAFLYCFCSYCLTTFLKRSFSFLGSGLPWPACGLSFAEGGMATRIVCLLCFQGVASVKSNNDRYRDKLPTKPFKLPSIVVNRDISRMLLHFGRFSREFAGFLGRMRANSACGSYLVDRVEWKLV